MHIHDYQGTQGGPLQLGQLTSHQAHNIIQLACALVSNSLDATCRYTVIQAGQAIPEVVTSDEDPLLEMSCLKSVLSQIQPYASSRFVHSLGVVM